MISGIMSFTKQKNVPGSAVFVDSEKAFDSIEWKHLQKYLEVATTEGRCVLCANTHVGT